MKVILSIIFLITLSCNIESSSNQDDLSVETNLEIPELEVYEINIPYNGTYYVSTRGSNTNSGSRENPWRTIEFGINSANPGDRVVILEGEYKESIYPTSSGAENSYITIQGEGDVIINTQESNCIGLLDNSYLYFKNLKLIGAEYANFGAYDDSYSGKVHNIILDNIESYGSFVGVSFSGVKDSLIINSSIHDNQYNLELIEYNEDITIASNNIHSTSITSPHLESFWSHSLMIYSTGDLGKVNRGIKVINNNIYGGDKQGLLAYRAENSLIEGNNCFNNGATGIQVESDDRRDSRNIIVQNNRCYNNSLRHETEAGIWIDDTVKAVVRNNEVFGNELGVIISGSKYVSAYNNNIYNNNHNSYINGGGLLVTSSKGQSGQNGVECSDIYIFNNEFSNNGALSQRAHIVLGYYENDSELRVSNIEFINNILANTNRSNIYDLDLQAFGDEIILNHNHYYNENRKTYFFWQMSRDPWGDYLDDPYILGTIPNIDLNSSFNKNNPPIKRDLAEVLEIVDSRTLILSNSKYFCDGFDLVLGDSVVIGSIEFTIEEVNYSTNLIRFTSDLVVSVGDKVNLN